MIFWEFYLLSVLLNLTHNKQVTIIFNVNIWEIFWSSKATQTQQQQLNTKIVHGIEKVMNCTYDNLRYFLEDLLSSQLDSSRLFQDKWSSPFSQHHIGLSDETKWNFTLDFLYSSSSKSLLSQSGQQFNFNSLKLIMKIFHSKNFSPRAWNSAASQVILLP